ncbi:MAG: very short patch repair endonuclease [Actinomycetota bacterium]|nr:very short patch repair endonuclease [Actinomycetota bacterium]
MSWASSEAIRRTMQGNTRANTKPEIRLRSRLHALGLRYRVDARPIADINRRADIVFPKAKVAVFVHGCFWHGCSVHYKPPSTNAEYWRLKRETNLRRDAETLRVLDDAGWLAIVVWEHEGLEDACARVARAVAEHRLIE